MGDVLPISKKITKASDRDRRALTARLTAMKPETLAAILSSAERGELKDWADLCDRMVQIDGHIRANYETRLAAVGGARWEMLPGASGDPKRDALAAEGRDFAEAVLRDCAPLDQAVMDLLDGIGVGVGVEEIDWEWRPDANAFVPADLRWIHQRRFRWGADWELALVDAGNGVSDPCGTPLSHWPRKFIVHAPKARSGYPSVTGCLRPVAWCYLFKRWATQFWVTGAERFAWPFMYGEVPRGATVAVRTAMKDALDRMSSDHTAVLEVGDAVKIVESQIKDGGTWKELHAALNAEISKSILGSTDHVEASKVGAWKAVESRKGTTVDARTAIDERQISATMTSTLVTWLLEVNAHRWGGVVPAIPRMRWVVAEKRREIPQHLVGAGVVTRNELRLSIGLDPIAGPAGDELVTDAPAQAAPKPAVPPPPPPSDDEGLDAGNAPTAGPYR
jgi:phage gp29-like protein